ncbi:MAG: OmpW/AlkL family protein [Commensalibacter sp.]|nr:outer membrane beta-barrel protein [Commensalibacter sp.]
MKKSFRSFAALAVSATVLSPLSSYAQVSAAPATAIAPANAPAYNTNVSVQPTHSGHCGVFETCNGITKIGYGKGDFVIHLNAVGVITNNTSSKTSVGGRVTSNNQVMPELAVNYFVTDNLAFELIATSTHHKIRAKGTAAGNVNVGKGWILPPTLTAQWHFLPHHRFNPYVGVGLTVAFWHNTKPGGGIIKKIDLETTVGPSFNVGFDYQVVGNWFVNVDAKQMLLNQRAHLNDAPNRIDARTSLHPTVVAGGIAYRF